MAVKTPKTASRRAPGANGAPVPPDKMTTPQGALLDKAEVFGWEVVDKPGKFMRISKRELHIDHDYQRKRVKHFRVNRIASRFSWRSFLTLGVAQRPDGTYWVFDGQHRKLAADKLSDIDLLPCMVFPVAERTGESKAFLDVNADRGAVGAFDRFDSLLIQNDPVAHAVKQMVEADGYKIAAGNAQFTVQCVGALSRCVSLDAEAATAAWKAAVEAYGGEPIPDRAMLGLFTFEKHLRKHELGSLSEAKFSQFAARLSPTMIHRSVVETVAYHGKGGPKVCGEAILRLYNRGRRNTIPSLYADRSESSDE